MMIVEQFCQQKKGTCLGSNLSFREGILGCKKGLRSRTAYLYQQEILDKEAIDAFGVHPISWLSWSFQIHQQQRLQHLTQSILNEKDLLMSIHLIRPTILRTSPCEGSP